MLADNQKTSFIYSHAYKYFKRHSLFTQNLFLVFISDQNLKRLWTRIKVSALT